MPPFLEVHIRKMCFTHHCKLPSYHEFHAGLNRFLNTIKCEEGQNLEKWNGEFRWRVEGVCSSFCAFEQPSDTGPRKCQCCIDESASDSFKKSLNNYPTAAVYALMPLSFSQVSFIASTLPTLPWKSWTGCLSKKKNWCVCIFGL